MVYKRYFKHASKAITWPFNFDASVFDHLCTLRHLAGVFIFFQSEDYSSVNKKHHFSVACMQSGKKNRCVFKNDLEIMWTGLTLALQ